MATATLTTTPLKKPHYDHDLDVVYCDPNESIAAELAAATIDEIRGYAMAYGNVHFAPTAAAKAKP